MTATTNKTVALIGLGGRVLDTVFPALRCASDRLEIVGAYQRTESSLHAFCQRWDIPPLTSVTDPKLEQVDLLSVCVHPSQLVGILKTWREAKLDFSKVTLMIDTPVLNPSGIRMFSMLKRFRKVIVAEDLIASPVHRVARGLIDEGRIGKVRRIELHHSGYRHHAMASLRMLAGDMTPGKVQRIRLGQSDSEYRLTFPGGAYASFLEPRDYAIGSFIVHGTQGTIADYDLRANREAGTHYWLGARHESGKDFRLTLNGEDLPQNENDGRLLQGLADTSADNSDLVDVLKIRALIDMLVGFADDRDELCYDFLDGIFDSWSLNFADRLGKVRNLSAPKLPLLLRMMWR